MGDATTRLSSDLARLIRRESRRLEREAIRARAGEAVGVHQARVASRRLREMLTVASADTRVSAEAVRRRVRRVTSALGPIRELDVACAIWHEADDSARWAPTTVEVLDRRAHLDRGRHVGAVRALDRVVSGQLPESLASIADAVERHASPRVIVAAIAASLRRRAQGVLKALAETGIVYVPVPLHDARIAIKKLRYAAELARDPGGAAIGRDIGRLKRLQDLLGRVHDLHVVQERIQSATGEERLARRALGAMKASEQALEVECRQLHGRFVAELQALGRSAERLRDETTVELLGRASTRLTRFDTRAPGRRSGAAQER